MTRKLLIVVGLFAAFIAGLLIRGGVPQHGHESVEASQPSGQKQLWTCGMHPQVIQDHPGNCPICHMELTPLKADNATSRASAQRKVKYWWDPMMNPPYIADKPGKSPMGMDLVPVYEDAISAGPAVTIDPVMVQNMGVRVALVQRASIQQQVRAVGYLEEPEPLHHDINLRISGWIEKLHANIDGMAIEKGQALFELYSPEIQVAVEELIAARKSTDAAAKMLLESATKKLELWGLQPQQVADLSKLDRAPATVTFLAPMGGHLTEKKVYEGAAVQAGTLVMRIADNSTMWIDAQVYEQQLPLVKIGSKARATVVSDAGKVFEGEVLFIHPHLDPMTRTAKVRIQVPNNTHALHEGMYATVEILSEPTPLAPVVPREAVIDTGTRQIAFVVAGGGRIEPRTVKLGLSGRDGVVQVLSGLAPGEQVVTSGQFLLDSESRLKEAIQKHLDTQLASRAVSAEMRAAAVPAPSTAAAVSATTQLSIPYTDEITVAYLEIAQALGAPQQSDDPIGVARLIDVAKNGSGRAEGEARKLVDAVASAATAMNGKPLAEQRRAFMKLSDSLIALADQSPPSAKVAQELYVIHCPMAFDASGGADWLQTTRAVANPYYATDMKGCGVVSRAISTRK